MRELSRSEGFDRPANSPPSPVTLPDAITSPLSNGSPATTDGEFVDSHEPAATGGGGETGRERFRRKAHRSRLHGYALVAVALVAYLIALAVANTPRVKVSWVFGSSHVSLVWLVLFAAILGWLLGLVVTAGQLDD